MDEIGIVGYGVSLPTRKLDTETLIRLREGKRADLNDFLEKVQKSLGLNTKSVAGPGEDTITFATEAAENAIRMSKIDLNEINSVLVGSESKPYAVGQIARHVASFVGIKEKAMTLDTEAACNPTMENLYLTYGMVKAKEFDFGLVVGADVSQAPKGDPLEYAAGAGAGAFVVGREDLIASLIDFSYYSSLTQDFWRREGQPVPRHHGKTTVRAYMTHVVGAIEQLLEKHPELTLDHFDFITFHQPSAYMPMKTVKAFSGMVDNIKPEELIKNPENIERMRLTDEQIDEKIRPTLVVPEIGNLYAGSTIVATSNVLDKSKPGQEILAVSYGSGAHTTATWLRVESGIEKKRGSVPSFQDYLNRRVPITVPEYLKLQTRKTLGIDYPIYVGTVDPVQGSGEVQESFCDTCQTIFYPPRERCLIIEDKNPLIQKTFPKLGVLKSIRKLTKIVPKMERTRVYDVLRSDEVALVSNRNGDLVTGMEVEANIKRLYSHGKSGIIVYGFAYEPKFRATFREFEKRLTDRLYEQPSAIPTTLLVKS